MVPVGDDHPVVSTHSVRQALELAEEFSRELHKRNPASGFIKTLLQRRVGSSVLAGFNTATGCWRSARSRMRRDWTRKARAFTRLPDEEKEMLSRLRDHLPRQLELKATPSSTAFWKFSGHDFEGDNVARSWRA